MSSRYLSLPGKKFFCCIYKTVYHFILKEEMLSSKLRTNLKSVIIFKEVEKMFVIKTQTIIDYTLEIILAIFFGLFFLFKEGKYLFYKKQIHLYKKHEAKLIYHTKQVSVSRVCYGFIPMTWFNLKNCIYNNTTWLPVICQNLIHTVSYHSFKMYSMLRALLIKMCIKEILKLHFLYKETLKISNEFSVCLLIDLWKMASLTVLP